MKLHMPRTLIFIAFIALLCFEEAKAQQASGIQIAALTVQERDSIYKELSHGGGLQLTFSCVPAGILVFTSNDQGASRASVRAEALNTLAPLIASNRIGPVELNQQAAEAACQATRGE